MSINDLAFLVLTALADQPRHGYAVLQEVKRMTDGATSPQVATLYRTIDRLEADGRIVEDGTEVVDGRFRRTYRLSDSGAAELAAEANRRAATARLASERLGRGIPGVDLAGGAS